MVSRLVVNHGSSYFRQAPTSQFCGQRGFQYLPEVQDEKKHAFVSFSKTLLAICHGRRIRVSSFHPPKKWLNLNQCAFEFEVKHLVTREMSYISRINQGETLKKMSAIACGRDSTNKNTGCTCTQKKTPENCF